MAAARGWRAFGKSVDWKHLLTELFIVVLGVFLGMQVSNWNDERREDARVNRMLDDLAPEVDRNLETLQMLEDYYAVTTDYGDTALAGFARDPAVSDEQFVIGAYQASQLIGTGINGAVWASIFGADEVAAIPDPDVRLAVATVLSNMNNSLDWMSLRTRYRDHVRQVIPDDIQQAIRQDCTDRNYTSESTGQSMTRLPAKCELDLPDGRFAQTAERLRATPSLIDELRQHRSEVATFVYNSNQGEGNMLALEKALAAR